MARKVGIIMKQVEKLSSNEKITLVNSLQAKGYSVKDINKCVKIMDDRLEGTAILNGQKVKITATKPTGD